MDLRSEADDENWANAIYDDWRTAPLSPQDRAICEYTEKLGVDPGSVGEADLEPLRATGLDDRAIHDLVQVIGYFHYINRVADGLGTDLEPEFPPHPERARE